MKIKFILAALGLLLGFVSAASAQNYSPEECRAGTKWCASIAHALKS